jgi:hypothetical protein
MEYKITIILAALLLLSGCKVCDHETNQDKRHAYFEECIKISGAQPEHNHEDNNGDLVKACDDAAYYQAQEKVCHE